MKFRITTHVGGEYLLEQDGRDLKIREAKVAYMQDQLLGKRVAEPRVEMPLVVYLSSTDVLYSNRIKKIEKIYD